MAQLAPRAIAPVSPDVSLIDGRVFTTSQNIAAVFGKRHDNVLRDILSLQCSPEFRLLNFEETVWERPNPSGGAPISSPAYRITRDGCAFLIMGFTGNRAAAFKEAYIAEFNRMEAQLRQQEQPAPSVVGRRWLVSIDTNGRETAQPVPRDAAVMTMPQFLTALGDLDGLTVDTPTLAEFIITATRRLENRTRTRKPTPT